jgi:hypothetical protein
LRKNGRSGRRREEEGKARITAMRKLSEQEIERIVSLLREGKPLPEDYKMILFDTKKEYELIYADKEREEDILADTMAVPLQPVKTLRNLPALRQAATRCALPRIRSRSR